MDYDEIAALWNADAGHMDKWDALGVAEKVEYAYQVGAERERNKYKSFGELHPRNHDAKCDCEHWQSCADCRELAKWLSSRPDAMYRLRQMYAEQAQPVEPVFWYRPIGNDGLYEGPLHHRSTEGLMLRDEKPKEWLPLFTIPQDAAAALSDLHEEKHELEEENTQYSAENCLFRDEIARLQGEAKVLRNLLSSSLGVIENCYPDDSTEADMLEELQNAIREALCPS